MILVNYGGLKGLADKAMADQMHKTYIHKHLRTCTQHTVFNEFLKHSNFLHLPISTDHKYISTRV